MKCQISIILVVLFSVNSLATNILISEQTDALGDASPGFCDIVASRVWQVDSSHYQLEIEVASDIPQTTDPDEWIRFIWYLDCDLDPNTGQPHGNIGSEFNIRSQQSVDPDNSYANIDVTGAINAIGGRIIKFISGRTVTVLVPFNKIGNASQFYWKCQITTASGGLNDQIADIALASPTDILFSKSVPERVVIERNISFKNSYTFKISEIYLQNHDGKPLRVESDDTIEFYPYLDCVDVTDSCISAREGEFQSVSVAARINGRLSDNVVVVQSGSTWVEPPILHLDLAPTGQSVGCLTAKAEDAYGNSIDLSSKEIIWEAIYGGEKIDMQTGATPENLEVTAVDIGDIGLATIRPKIDGIKANSGAHVRISASHYDFPAFEYYQGDLATFFVPAPLCFSQAGGTINEMMAQYQVIEVTDTVIALQYGLTGSWGSNADQQYYTAVLNDETGNFSGESGNPIKLGFWQNEQYPNSSIQDHDTGLPRWSTFFHECGHSATGSNSRCNTYLHNGVSPLAQPFNEADASIAGMYAMWKLIQDPNLAGLNPASTASLNNPDNYGSFSNRRSDYMDELSVYEADPNLLNVNPDVIDGMYIYLCEAYGWDKLPRFFSIFLPEEGVFNFDPHQDQTSFIAACLSAAFQDDLLEILRDRWAFPIDEGFYYDIMPELQKLAALRDKPHSADISNDGSVDFIDFSIFAESWMTALGEASYNPKCDLDTEGTSENIINCQDLAVLTGKWLTGVP